MKSYLLASWISFVAGFTPVSKPHAILDVLREGTNVNEMVSAEKATSDLRRVYLIMMPYIVLPRIRLLFDCRFP